MHTGSQLKGEECQNGQYLIIGVVQYSTHVLYTVAVHKSLYLYVHVHYKNMYLGLFLGGSPLFRQQNRRWLSISMDVSSENITSKYLVSASCKYFVAHSSRFPLFASRIIWQYALLLTVHPNDCLQRSTELCDSVNPLAVSCSRSYFTVVSSSVCMAFSTVSLTLSACFEGLPLPERLAMLPVVSTRKKKSLTPLLLTIIPSFPSRVVIEGAR